MELDVKKGDIIEKRIELEPGFVLIRGLNENVDISSATDQINVLYNIEECPSGPGFVLTKGLSEGSVNLVPDDENPGKLALVLKRSARHTLEAKVNWRVDHEIGITYVRTDGMAVLDLNNEEGWVVIYSAKPQLQSSVENMTDEELRASIEELREIRMTERPSKKAKVSRSRTSVTPEQKAFAQVMDSMSEEERLELMKKMGLVD